MENEIQRINKVLVYLKISKNKLGISIGDKNGMRFQNVLSGRNGISEKLAKDITDNYPQISYEWLLNGKGSMLSNDNLVTTEELNLENQEFKVTIKKGNSIFEATKIIKDIALPLWQEIMNEANDNEYLFSKDLRPGIIHISSRQVTIRWKRHVKDRLGITADFYSLKHLNTTEVTEIAGETAAAKLNSHTTTKMVKEVYDVNNKSRRNTLLKSIKNVFA